MPTNNNVIYQELAKRAQGKNTQSMEGRLISNLDIIIQDATGHLSRVNQFLPEFDDHSVKHSEAVLDNMAQIIGEEGVTKLSVYDLFILAASAYLHDLGMALTGYEREVLTLAEKEPLPVNIGGVAGCKKTIVDNSSSVFGQQIEDALTINILPQERTKLIDFFAKLYEDYQNFRNGFTEKYRNAKEEDEKDELNKNIRMDYIRETHPKRSSDYVKHWGNRIQKENPSLSKIFNDVAKVVQGHGESINYIETELNKTAKYAAIREGSNEANLQYAAILLRLGDIADFTYERAPANLRKEIRFHSKVSREQWMVKTGVTKAIEKTENQTKIIFNASCASPRAYCYLKKYIGYINFEIESFNALQSEWKDRYQIPLVPVEDQVEPLNDGFETRPNLTFTLNQNKILELLMGVQLYKDPYTCLRELYQNSLDACRCAIARRKTLDEGKDKDSPTCTIEFGMEKDDKGNKFVYCLDDGKGMSRSIIENYFLKIGSSYYKSKEFFTEWAKNNGGFTPTSQFGIGILSCFMIGDRLEVVTKEFGGELISFGVDGPQETFYYWNKDNISSTDKETFEHRLSGTLVKVYLKEQYAKELDDGELDKLELLKCTEFDSDDLDSLNNYNSSDVTEEYETKYMELFKRWNCHIYKKIFDFVQIPFPEIRVQVHYANGSHPIEPRPHLAKLQDNIDMVEYPIKISHSNYIFHSMMCLPSKDIGDYHITEFSHTNVCVDGININYSRFEESTYNPILFQITSRGVINFVGENKPQITVDRCSLVNPVHIDGILQLISEYLDELILITNEHIVKYSIGIDTQFYQKIWKLVIGNLSNRLRILLTNHFDKQGYPQLKSNLLSDILGLDENVPAILSKLSIPLPLVKPNYNSLRRRQGFDVFLLKKMYAIKTIKSTNDETLVLGFDNLPVLPYIDDADDDNNSFVIGIPKDVGLFKNYDIVNAYYPLVSHRLAKGLIPCFTNHDFTNHKGTRIVSYSFHNNFIVDCNFITQEYCQYDQFSNQFRHKYGVLSVLSFEFRKKRIDLVKYKHYAIDILNQTITFDNNNDGITYNSCYFHNNKTSGGKNSESVSIIIPKQKTYTAYNYFLIAKGRFTRIEMDEIVRIGRKMMK